MNSRAAKPAATTGKSRSVWQALFVVSVALALGVRLFHQVSYYAVNLFFSDQWDIDDATLFGKRSLWEMFRWQHGAHRQGVGALLSYFVEPHFRWNGRAEAFMATSIVAVAAICALYLKTRLWGPLSFADIAIPLIFLTPAQYESLWETTNFSYSPLPLLLVVLYCLALTCERAVARCVLVLIINFLAIYTGYGLLVGLITPFWLMLEYYWKRAAAEKASFIAIPWLISVASLGSFFSGYQFGADTVCSAQRTSLLAYPRFVVLQLAHFLGGRHTRSIAAHLLGVLVLGAMIYAFLELGKRLKDSRSYVARNAIPAILIGYTLLFCAVSAYGRACLDPINAFASRYTNYIAAGMLGLYLYSIGGKKEQKILQRSLLMMLLLGSVWPHGAAEEMQFAHDIKSRWRSCYLRTEDIQQCDAAAGHWIYPAPEATHLKEKLEYLKQNRLNLYSDAP